MAHNCYSNKPQENSGEKNCLITLTLQLVNKDGGGRKSIFGRQARFTKMGSFLLFFLLLSFCWGILGINKFISVMLLQEEGNVPERLVP